MSPSRASHRGHAATLEQLSAAVLDNIPARIALLDRRRHFRYVNQELAVSVGKRQDAIIGRTITQVIGAESAARFRSLRTRAFAGETVRWEGWQAFPDGRTDEPRFIQRIYVPHRTGFGTVTGLFVFSRDLTDLARSRQQIAEQLAALRASEAMSAAVIASALDCVIVIDVTGTVAAFNPAAERTFRYREADVLGRSINELIVPPAMRTRHADGFRRYLETGHGTMLGGRVVIEAMRAGASVFPAGIAITEVRLPERRLFTAHLRDLTQAKAAAEIERQRQALHRSEKMAALGSFLTGVAHELSNPLSIALSNILMLEEDVQEGATSDLADRTARVREAADRCARVVHDFLAAARPGAVGKEPVAPGRLVRSTLDPLRDLLQVNGIEVVRDIAAGLPQVPGDFGQLRRMLAHLLTNAQQALQATAAPRIAVTTCQSGAAVEIAVADNGPDVPADMRDRIFDPFFTTRPAGTGLGLGLAVSRGICRGAWRLPPVHDAA